MTQIDIAAIFKEGFEPSYSTLLSSGADLKANLENPLVLEPGGRKLIPTGVRLHIPAGFEGQVRPRSGLAQRHGVTVLNAPGTIDSDYRGEIKVILYNTGKENFIIQPGDRIAQIVFAEVVRGTFKITRELETSSRGEGGFGSTGT